MKIAIIGAGNVGTNLAKGWIAAGHDVVLGVRDPQGAKTKAALDLLGSNACADDPAAAAAWGEVVVIAVPGGAVSEAVPALGNLSGKVVIDVTNYFATAERGADSNSAVIARLAPGAKVVKAFNTMAAETMGNPRFGSESASTFICADDPGAKETVMRLAADLGIDPVDAGPLSNAGLTEVMTKLWVALARVNGRNVAFRLVRR